MSGNPGIELSFAGLRKVYDEHTILDGLTVTIAAGSTVALIGPSGGGKSTLLRCLNGLTPFEAGEVRVGAHRLGPGPVEGTNRAAAQQIRRLLGMIFQDFQLFPHLTAIENLVEAPVRVLGKSMDEARAEATRLLDRVGLAQRRDAYPRALSGGQKQRVAIARALLKSPRILIFDEATSALDSRAEKAIQAELERIAQGRTTLVIAHRLSTVMDADQILVLGQGRILERGTHDQLLEAKGEYARMWALQQQQAEAAAVLEQTAAL